MTRTSHTQTTQDFTPFIEGLSSDQIKTIKKEACRELYKKGLKHRLSETLSPREKFIEYATGVSTFDNIEEFFANNTD